MVTESDRLAAALDAAAELWPAEGHERAALLRRIIDAGIDAVDLRAAQRRETRSKAVSDAAGSLTEVWPENWREELRDEWPA